VKAASVDGVKAASVESSHQLFSSVALMNYSMLERLKTMSDLPLTYLSGRSWFPQTIVRVLYY
jgi:hypothetical protein